MTLFNKKLGAVLKNIRNERNLSQQEIADRLGVSRFGWWRKNSYWYDR